MSFLPTVVKMLKMECIVALFELSTTKVLDVFENATEPQRESFHVQIIRGK